MKKLILFLAALLLFSPVAASAVTAIPWSQKNLNDNFIIPSLVNGNPLGLIVNASSTVIGAFNQSGGATSTFSNGINILRGCFSVNGVCLATTAASSTLLRDNNTFSGANIFNGFLSIASSTVTGNLTLATTTTGSLNGTVIVDGVMFPSTGAGVVSAVAYCSAIGTCGHVHIPAGTYTLSNGLTVPSGMLIDGDGYATNLSVSASKTIAFNGVASSSLQNIRVDCINQAAGNECVDIKNSASISIDHSYITNAQGFGVFVEANGTSSSTANSIINSNLTGLGNNDLIGGGPADSTGANTVGDLIVTGNHLTQISTIGHTYEFVFDIVGGKHIDFSNNIIEGKVAYGYEQYPNTFESFTGNDLRPAIGGTFTQIFVQSSTSSASQGGSIIVSNNNIQSGEIQLVGISTQKIRNAAVNGNVVMSGSAQNGITLTSVSSSVAENNVIRGDGSDDGFHLTNTDFTIIDYNFISLEKNGVNDTSNDSTNSIYLNMTNSLLSSGINTVGFGSMVFVNGNLGVGTTTPQEPLVVESADLSSFQNSTRGIFSITGTGANSYQALDFASCAGGAGCGIPISRIAQNVTGSGTNLLFGTSNNFAGGITNTALKLDFNGNAYFNQASSTLFSTFGPLYIGSAATTTIRSDATSTFQTGINLVSGCVTYNGGACIGTNSGTITSVSATYPLSSSGGMTPIISSATSSASSAGVLSAADWTTFNNKLTRDPFWVFANSAISTSTPVLITASTTIGDSTQTNGLTISGGSTTTLKAYFASNVGIGTTSPSSLLTVSGNTNGVFTIAGNGADQVLMNLYDTNTGTSGAGAFQITASSTTAFFKVYNSIYTNAALRDSFFIGQTTGVGGLLFDTELAAPIRFSTNGFANERMRITSAGFVGIGTTSPGSLFSIAGTSGILASTTATSTFVGGGINLITGAGNTGCFAVNGACVGNNVGTVTSVATNGTLTGGTITTTGTLGLNLANSNWWTATQNFTNASTSLFTATSTAWFLGAANFGSTQQSGFSATGVLTLGTALSIGSGGTATTTQVTNGVNFFDGTRITSGTALTFNGTTFSNGASSQGGGLDINSNDSYFGAGVNGSGTFIDVGSLGDASNVWLDAKGSATDVGMNLRTKGAGTFVFNTGKVGINITPTALLNIAGTGATGQFKLGSGSNSWELDRDNNTTGRFGILEAGSTERLTILNGGNTGIGTTTPTATLTTQLASSTLAVASAFDVWGLMNTVEWLFQRIDEWGHMITSGPAPTLSFCGTSTISGNDANGTITLIGTALTSCTMTYAHAYAAAPDPVVSDNTTASVADITTNTASSITFGLSVGLNSGTLYYQIKQHQ